jgi:hypothetical protein
MIRRLLKRRPSPAMMVAFVALMLALGGTSFAAVKLAANSVGNAQLKKNAVTSAKVKNGSLTSADFKAGALRAGPAGAAGAAGAAGPAGVAGAQGPKGDKGDPGNTNTFTYRRTADAGSTIDIATFGPFTLKGHCTGTSANPTAQWTISTDQDHSAFTDYNNSYLTDFGASDGDQDIEYSSTSASPASPDMAGPYDGTFAAMSPDLGTYITGSLSTGTYVGGASNPACQFAGVVFAG